MGRSVVTRDEELRERALRRVIRAETWRRERIVNHFRFVFLVAVGVAEWIERSGHSHDHLTIMPFLFIGWGVAVEVFNMTWLRRNFRSWIPAAITTGDILVLSAVIRVVYTHAVAYNEATLPEAERAMVGFLLLMSVNVIRFSWRTSLWSGVCALAAFGYIRVYTGTMGTSATITDFLIFAGMVTLLVIANRSFRTVTERLLVDLRDVQERRLASLRALVAGVAHEVNSPLAAMSGNAHVSARAAEILQKRIESPDPDVLRALGSLQETASANRVAIDRISSIVRSLRDFARIDDADTKEVDVRDSLHTCVELLSDEIGDRIDVSTHYTGDMRLVCDPARLNQVFMHVLRNAVESIEGRGRIAIEGRRDEDSVCLEIADTGRGIPDKVLKNIFDLQFGKKEGRVGMAMGLPISQSIVHDHRGTIKVDSTVGTGTKVTLRLPGRQ